MNLSSFPFAECGCQWKCGNTSTHIFTFRLSRQTTESMFISIVLMCWEKEFANLQGNTKQVDNGHSQFTIITWIDFISSTKREKERLNSVPLHTIQSFPHPFHFISSLDWVCVSMDYTRRLKKTSKLCSDRKEYELFTNSNLKSCFGSRFSLSFSLPIHSSFFPILSRSRLTKMCR